MPKQVTTDEVWRAIEGGLFAVVGWVNSRGEPRSAGVIYTVDNRQLYAHTDGDSWKARHLAQNPAVSVTVTLPKRIPLMPWIKIPAATASFHGEAKLHDLGEMPEEVIAPLVKGLELTDEVKRQAKIIRIQPVGHFVCYGIGVPLTAMRDPEAAAARVPV